MHSKVPLLLDEMKIKKYALVTPEGVFNMLEHEMDYLRWKQAYKNEFQLEPLVVSKDAMNFTITPQAVLKVVFNKKENCLCVRFAPFLKMVFVDENAPKPLKKKYKASHVTFARDTIKLYSGKITDPKFISKVKRMKQDSRRKSQSQKDKYLEVLSKWKGYIRVSYDITKEFNEFQEYLRYKLNEKNSENRKERFNNRKYFVNKQNKMPWLRWNKTNNRIEYDEYVLLDSTRVVSIDVEDDLISILEGSHCLDRILSFCVQGDVATVCRTFEARIALIQRRRYPQM